MGLSLQRSRLVRINVQTVKGSPLIVAKIPNPKLMPADFFSPSATSLMFFQYQAGGAPVVLSRDLYRSVMSQM